MTVRPAEARDCEAVITPQWAIREADTNDIEDLLLLGFEHWKQLPWSDLPPDTERLRRLFVWGMTTVGAKSWVLEHRGAVAGFIGLHLFEDIWTGRLIANEVWWYVSEEARKGMRGALLLLSTAEQWAREHNAIMQISVHDERIGKLLERLSYNKTEISYQKGM